MLYKLLRLVNIFYTVKNIWKSYIWTVEYLLISFVESLFDCKTLQIGDVVLVSWCQKTKLKNVTHLSVNRRRRSSENTELEVFCAWVDGETTDTCHKLYPIISSIWTERNFRTIPREENIWSKFSAGRKFVRCRVNVALRWDLT